MNAESFNIDTVFAWLSAAIVGAVVGAVIDQLVTRRLKRFGNLEILRTRIIATDPREEGHLHENIYFLELRIHNSSGVPKIIESPIVTFNTHRKGVRGQVRISSPYTQLICNEPEQGMNVPFRLLHEAGEPVEYIIIPAEELSVTRVRLDTIMFDFLGIAEPRRSPNRDLESALSCTHVLLHYRLPGEEMVQSKLIIDTTEREKWKYQGIVYFPEAGTDDARV